MLLLSVRFDALQVKAGLLAVRYAVVVDLIKPFVVEYYSAFELCSRLIPTLEPSTVNNGVLLFSK